MTLCDLCVNYSKNRSDGPECPKRALLDAYAQALGVEAGIHACTDFEQGGPVADVFVFDGGSDEQAD